jgi:hypothetical protein
MFLWLVRAWERSLEGGSRNKVNQLTVQPVSVYCSENQGTHGAPEMTILNIERGCR